MVKKPSSHTRKPKDSTSNASAAKAFAKAKARVKVKKTLKVGKGINIFKMFQPHFKVSGTVAIAVFCMVAAGLCVLLWQAFQPPSTANLMDMVPPVTAQTMQRQHTPRVVQTPVKPISPPEPIDPLADIREPLPEAVSVALPVFPKDDRPPAWHWNKTPPKQGGKIAIVIDDLGLNRKATSEIITMPKAITMAFLPYADDLQPLVDSAKAAGHEVIVHMPMQPDNANADPGRNALLVSDKAIDIYKKMRVNLSEFTGYTGINNHMGSHFTADSKGMAVVFRVLRDKKLFFLDSKTTNTSVAPALAEKYGVPILERDVFLDHEDTPEFIKAALQKTEDIARQKGVAIAIGHPHPNTIKALKAWIPTLKDKQFELVSLSSLLPKATNTEAADSKIANSANN